MSAIHLSKTSTILPAGGPKYNPVTIEHFLAEISGRINLFQI